MVKRNTCLELFFITFREEAIAKQLEREGSPKLMSTFKLSPCSSEL